MKTELQLRTFDFLRFPLMVGVVFIHMSITNGSSGEFLDVYPFDGGGENTTRLFCNLFSETLSRISVPIFFIISSYLFFYNCNFTKGIYKRKLKSRLKTLFVPFIFWNALLLLIFIAKDILEHGAETVLAWPTWLTAFWSWKDTHGPIMYHFWFIRDLMVCVVLSPVFYWIIKRTKYTIPLLFGTVWLFSLSIPYLGSQGLSTDALCFFSLGAYLSLNKKNIMELVENIGTWILFLYAGMVLLDVFTKGLDYNIYIHKIGIYVGIICCFKISGWLIEVKKIRMLPFLTSANFFLYAVHGPYMQYIAFKLFGLYVPQSDFFLILWYLGRVLVVVLLSLLTYHMLKRLFPRFTAVITGGR